ncbi:WD40-repeat-containing domain protein [Podospora conica]|nr:WD40-repeat-containing domain protein [Schizothecium conicum]
MDHDSELGAHSSPALATTSPTSSTTPQPSATFSKRPPTTRLARSSTGTSRKDKEREKDVEQDADVHNVEGPPRPATSTTLAAALKASLPQATPPSSASAIDPLSQPKLPRHRHSSRPESPSHMTEVANPPPDIVAKPTIPIGDVLKDKKKGPSFLSRLGMRGIKKKDARDMDSDSELGSEVRMDGINALVFSQSLAAPYAGVGYIPHHKEPPRYIRTKSNNKKVREFDRMFLAQELVGTLPQAGEENGAPPEGTGKTPIVTVSVAGANGRRVAKTGGAIWATEFSKDGKYFATAGKDHVVRIWAVISTPEDRKASEEEEAANGGSGERLSAPVFRCRPVQEFQGHTGEVLDLTWSKNNFLLSSSMDKTVRLWHISRAESICTFKHKDFVTRLAFHPTDDRFFLAGSLDTMLRLWSIPDKTVAFSVQLPDLVTAVAFTPDGRTAIAGLLSGLCLFYDTEGLTLQTQLHVRSSRGKNAKGSKITSIQTLSVLAANSPDNASQAGGSTSASHTAAHLPDKGEVRVLITSNDSRIRIYNLRDKTLEIKLKGHDNSCAQIAASFSDDGNHVICGSEDRKAFIWSLNDGAAVAQDKDKTPCEYFDAHGDMVTTAVFAPTNTRMLLGHSGDPIYDLCNPPPVVLRCIGDEASAAASQSGQGTPVTASHVPSKRPEPSAGYITRSTHYDGNIIVTTDDTGIIKVFRQDCAYTKRRNENWETGSTISRKLTAHGGGVFVGNGVGRSASILTRTSASSAAHSRRGSISQSVGSGVVASPRLGTHPTSSDRILSWRQSIEHGHDRRNNGSSVGASTPTRSSVRSERSPSPSKNRTPLGSSAVNLASDARRQPYAHSTLTSPTASVFSHATPDQRPSVRLVRRPDTSTTEEDDTPRHPPLPSFTYRPAAPAEQDEQMRSDQGATSNSTPFWALSRWKGIAGFKASGTSSQGQAGHSRAPSNGSLLGWSKSRIGGGDGAGDDGEEPAAEAANDKGKGKEKHSRRQSLGVSGFVPAEEQGGRRRSLPPGHARAGSADAGRTPTISVQGSEGEDVDRGRAVNPVQARHDRSPYRHLWGKGSGAGNSRRSSDRGADEDIEEVEETSDDEFTDAEQGTPRK